MQIFNDTIVAETSELPEALAAIAEIHAQGRTATLLPAEGELHLTAAADFLNVSYEFMRRLLDEGALPSRGSGPRARFVPVRALAAYHVKRSAIREELFQAMADDAQRLGLADDYGPVQTR